MFVPMYCIFEKQFAHGLDMLKIIIMNHVFLRAFESKNILDRFFLKIPFIYYSWFIKFLNTLQTCNVPTVKNIFMHY